MIRTTLPPPASMALKPTQHSIFDEPEYDMSNLSIVHTTQKRLVENITLLWTLTETPERPKDNILSNNLSGCHDKARQLTLERERQLAESFAFISASTDDMLRVMAVGIEEDPDQNGMTVCLASNTGDLSSMTQSFEGLAKTLEKAALRGKTIVA